MSIKLLNRKYYQKMKRFTNDIQLYIYCWLAFHQPEAKVNAK